MPIVYIGLSVIVGIAMAFYYILAFIDKFKKKPLAEPIDAITPKPQDNANTNNATVDQLSQSGVLEPIEIKESEEKLVNNDGCDQKIRVKGDECITTEELDPSIDEETQATTSEDSQRNSLGSDKKDEITAEISFFNQHDLTTENEDAITEFLELLAEETSTTKSQAQYVNRPNLLESWEDSANEEEAIITITADVSEEPTSFAAVASPSSIFDEATIQVVNEHELGNGAAANDDLLGLSSRSSSVESVLVGDLADVSFPSQQNKDSLFEAGSNAAITETIDEQPSDEGSEEPTTERTVTASTKIKPLDTVEEERAVESDAVLDEQQQLSDSESLANSSGATMEIAGATADIDNFGSRLPCLTASIDEAPIDEQDEQCTTTNFAVGATPMKAAEWPGDASTSPQSSKKLKKIANLSGQGRCERLKTPVAVRETKTSTMRANLNNKLTSSSVEKSSPASQNSSPSDHAASFRQPSPAPAKKVRSRQKQPRQSTPAVPKAKQAKRFSGTPKAAIAEALQEPRSC